MILRPLFQWRPIGDEKQAGISGGSHLTSDILPQNVLTKQMK